MREQQWDNKIRMWFQSVLNLGLHEPTGLNYPIVLSPLYHSFLQLLTQLVCKGIFKLYYVQVRAEVHYKGIFNYAHFFFTTSFFLF